jgi:hypothetical protein
MDDGWLPELDVRVPDRQRSVVTTLCISVRLRTMTGAPEFDTSVPHVARVYDYLLGGKDNFAADRALGEKIKGAYPDVVFMARANRDFLARAVRFLTRDRGIRQFLDVGTGIPAANNTHEIAQREAPTSRIVYVDNDPIVLTHAKALLRSSPEGVCDYIDADLNDPEAILTQAAETLDFSQPIAVMLIAVMHFVVDDATAESIVDKLIGACPPGSYVALTHTAADIDSEQLAEMTRRVDEAGAIDSKLRDRAGVGRLFGGLELVEPGLVRAPQWRPDTEEEAKTPAALWSGVAIKR